MALLTPYDDFVTAIMQAVDDKKEVMIDVGDIHAEVSSNMDKKSPSMSVIIFNDPREAKMVAAKDSKEINILWDMIRSTPDTSFYHDFERAEQQPYVESSLAESDREELYNFNLRTSDSRWFLDNIRDGTFSTSENGKRTYYFMGADGNIWSTPSIVDKVAVIFHYPESSTLIMSNNRDKERDLRKQAVFFFARSMHPDINCSNRMKAEEEITKVVGKDVASIVSSLALPSTLF